MSRLTPCFFVLAIGLFTLSACHSTKKVDSSQAEVQPTEEANETGQEHSPNAPVEVSPATDSLFFTYERTPCFGRCPIFKIRAYHSGYVTYEGINFVDYMGFYQSKMSEQQVLTFVDKIEEIDFFNFQNLYDDESLSDLPSRIFVVNHGGEKKRVVARYEAPEKLNSFGVFIENEFKDTKWVPVTHDH